MKQELATIQQELAPAAQPPTTADLMRAVVEGGINPASVEVMERLCALQEQQEAKQAKQAFARAFVALQRGLAPVRATSESDRHKYAAYETIMKDVAPLLSEHGFAVRFDTEYGEGKLTAICTLMHEGGHSESNRYTVRVSKIQGTTDAQSDGGTGTYARRYALCHALNITVDKDDTDGADARTIGGPITAEEARKLREGVKSTKTNAKRFLSMAGLKVPENATAEDYIGLFAAIPSGKLGELRQVLADQAAKRRAEQEQKEEAAPDEEF